MVSQMPLAGTAEAPRPYARHLAADCSVRWENHPKRNRPPEYEAHIAGCSATAGGADFVVLQKISYKCIRVSEKFVFASFGCLIKIFTASFYTKQAIPMVFHAPKPSLLFIGNRLGFIACSKHCIGWCRRMTVTRHPPILNASENDSFNRSVLR